MTGNEIKRILENNAKLLGISVGNANFEKFCIAAELEISKCFVWIDPKDLKNIEKWPVTPCENEEN